MHDLLQKLLPKTPENSSSFLDSTPETTPPRSIEPFGEVRSHEAVQIQRQRMANALRLPVEYQYTAPLSEVEARRNTARNIAAAGSSIVNARNREIAKDGGFSMRFNASIRGQAKVGFAEVVLGKKAAKAMKKSLDPLLLQPTPKYPEQEAAYMRRELEVGKRVLGVKDMQFFCRDAYTWVWHIDDDRQMTFLYHVRPDGVLKEQIGGEISQLKDDELAHFSHWTAQYHKEVHNTVYRQAPASTSPRYQDWAPSGQLSYN